MTDKEDNQLPAIREGRIGGVAAQTVDARELHRCLKAGKVFAAWIGERINRFGFQRFSDYEVFSEIGNNPEGGRPSKEYTLTLDMAKELAMVENNTTGRLIRKYFIECERRANAPMAALNDPGTLRALLLENVEARIAAEAQIEADKPKTGFYDAFASADGLFTLQNAGRAITGRPNKFIQSLKRTFLFYQGGKLVPYVQYRQQGLFEVKVEMVDDRAFPSTYITPKGLQYFAQKFGNPEGLAH